ncbi:GntR family transcriptional regulator [Bacillus freudenreichii]|nr:GntR family transcriptional regulator [Bacillus freudenreichii]
MGVRPPLDFIYDFKYDKSMMIKENKQQRAYRIIKSRIVEKVYVPGQRLVIDQLARELETSSIPIREAIRQLEAEGLIEYKHNIGPVVAPINESEYYENLQVLAVLEGYAVASCSQKFPAAKIMKLKEKNKQMKEALEDFDIIAFAKLNVEFHQIIYEESTNRVLIENIQNLWKRLDSIRGIGSTLYSVRVKESIKEHEEIISLLEKKADPQKIEELVRMHKLRTAEDFERRRSMKMENTSES